PDLLQHAAVMASQRPVGHVEAAGQHDDTDAMPRPEQARDKGGIERAVLGAEIEHERRARGLVPDELVLRLAVARDLAGRALHDGALAAPRDAMDDAC